MGWRSEAAQNPSLPRIPISWLVRIVANPLAQERLSPASKELILGCEAIGQLRCHLCVGATPRWANSVLGCPPNACRREVPIDVRHGN